MHMDASCIFVCTSGWCLGTYHRSVVDLAALHLDSGIARGVAMLLPAGAEPQKAWVITAYLCLLLSRDGGS